MRVLAAVRSSGNRPTDGPVPRRLPLAAAPKLIVPVWPTENASHFAPQYGNEKFRSVTCDPVS